MASACRLPMMQILASIYLYFCRSLIAAFWYPFNTPIVSGLFPYPHASLCRTATCSYLSSSRPHHGATLTKPSQSRIRLKPSCPAAFRCRICVGTCRPTVSIGRNYITKVFSSNSTDRNTLENGSRTSADEKQNDPPAAGGL